MYYVNGCYVKEEEARISILDLAILRGFGIFDYLRTYHGRPFHLLDHLLRLKYSAEEIGLTLPHTLAEIAHIVETLLTLNPFPESSIKILVTGGISPDQFLPRGKSNLIAFTYPLTPYPAHFFTEGIPVITTHLNRSVPTSKTTQYTAGIVALQKAQELQPQEALYLNAHNEILEGTTSNFFAFKGDILYTCCSEEVLIGITREVVLKLAAPHFRIKKCALHIQEIPQIQEAFITASNKEVMPVVQIDSYKVGDGKVGPHTQRLMELFRTYTQQSEWPFLNIARYQTIPNSLSHLDFLRQPLSV